MEVLSPRGDGDWEAFAAVSAQSFGSTLDTARAYVERVRPHALCRLALEENRVVGGALAFPAGQYFGGRAVPAGAVADVCVVPERRGRGIAPAVMNALVDSMRGAGCAVSPLWPATTRFYRALGWEVAGPADRHVVPTALLAGLRGRGEAVPAVGPEAREVRGACAPSFDGPLERPGWWWEWRDPLPPPEGRRRYAWRSPEGRLTGFLAFRQQPAKPGQEWGIEISVTDLWAEDGDALDGLLALLGAHGAQADEVAFDPCVPDLLLRLPEQHIDGTMETGWMLRLVDPEAALAARGWPTTVEGRIELEVTDAGPKRLVLEVQGGRGVATAGGAGRVRLGPGALAAWYAGGLRASRAARLGLASGPDEDLALMDVLTGDRPTWLPDGF